MSDETSSSVSDCVLTSAETSGSSNYVFYPVKTQALKFRVKASSDAFLILTSSGPDSQQTEWCEICIGVNNNNTSTIRRNGIDVVELKSNQILSPKLFKNFWLTFYDKIVAFGSKDCEEPLMLLFIPELLNVTHYGLKTGVGINGSWTIDDSWEGWNPISEIRRPKLGEWIPACGGDVPENALIGGYDKEFLYVGRAYHNGSIVPGKVHPSHGVCYVPWGSMEHGKTEYEVLCNCEGKWQLTSLDNIPPNAIQGGISQDDDEPLFIGRAPIEHTITTGKVQASHRVCYLSYAGREWRKEQYEILVNPL